MDTDFAPTGEARLRQILDAVVAEGDAAEHLDLTGPKTGHVDDNRLTRRTR